MWSYYGSKTNIVDAYPHPLYDTIIEPFAGAAKYALKYYDRSVTLIEKSKTICGIWEFLIHADPSDIAALPHFLETGDRLSNYTFACKGARDLMSFVSAKGVEHSTKDKISSWVGTDRPNHINFNLKRIERDLFKIRHWKIINADYRVAPDIVATWFIDPPYMKGGEHYPCSSKSIDYNFLARWCMQRKGQAIVCENAGGDWLPFKPLISHRVRKGSQWEYMWSSHPFNYQLRLFDEFE